MGTLSHVSSEPPVSPQTHLFRPAQRGEGKKRRRKPCVQDVGVCKGTGGSGGTPKGLRALLGGDRGVARGCWSWVGGWPGVLGGARAKF